jgi:hypothetical protein
MPAEYDEDPLLRHYETRGIIDGDAAGEELERDKRIILKDLIPKYSEKTPLWILEEEARRILKPSDQDKPFS